MNESLALSSCAHLFSLVSVRRVYDPEFYRLVQSNLGHVDSVRSIIHIPERNQVP